MPSPPFVVRPVNWTASREKLKAVRRAVFIEEQRVPEELEWDEVDERAYHVLALDDEDQPIGTGRLMLDGRIGRMAVLKDWRGRGVGASIMRVLLDLARKEGCTGVSLHAQTHALEFYRRFGFKPKGRVFDEAGIPHRAMLLKFEGADETL